MKPRIHHLREPIGVALETLRTHKMRSFLMLLGIVLSVSTLIMVVALISGVNLVRGQSHRQSRVERIPGSALSDHHGHGRIREGHPAEQTDHLGRLYIFARQFKARRAGRRPGKSPGPHQGQRPDRRRHDRLWRDREYRRHEDRGARIGTLYHGHRQSAPVARRADRHGRRGKTFSWQRPHRQGTRCGRASL